MDCLIPRQGSSSQSRVRTILCLPSTAPIPARCSLSDSSILHFGSVDFVDGEYVRAAGSPGWIVQPIEGFGKPVGPPLGQVRILFREPIDGAYTVVVTAIRLPTTPTLCANCGRNDKVGFVVHLFDPVGFRTLQNGGFSFLVMRSTDQS